MSIQNALQNYKPHLPHVLYGAITEEAMDLGLTFVGNRYNDQDPIYGNEAAKRMLPYINQAGFAQYINFIFMDERGNFIMKKNQFSNYGSVGIHVVDIKPPSEIMQDLREMGELPIDLHTSHNIQIGAWYVGKTSKHGISILTMIKPIIVITSGMLAPHTFQEILPLRDILQFPIEDDSILHLIRCGMKFIESQHAAKTLISQKKERDLFDKVVERRTQRARDYRIISKRTKIN